MSLEWTKLTVTVDTKHLDGASSIMSMLENGLMIEDYSDFSLNGMYGELVDESILNADKSIAKISIFVSEDKNLSEYTSFIKTRFEIEKIDFKLDAEGLNEEDWAHAWKKYYKPIKLGKITVVPAWESYEESEGEIVIRMDPGMAFGTGTHETTRLVMRLMQNERLEGCRVLDIGTGSGILSICASKLGASKIYAYDIDPVAVKVARENVRDGGCDNIVVGVSDLLSGVDGSEKYDFCLANIVAEIIIRMLPGISEYLKEDATLILSGIIEPSKQDVLDALAKYGFCVLKEEKENDWVALLVKKRTDKEQR
jgi:ribosomal protein L11 methyltransferase